MSHGDVKRASPFSCGVRSPWIMMAFLVCRLGGRGRFLLEELRLIQVTDREVSDHGDGMRSNQTKTKMSKSLQIYVNLRITQLNPFFSWYLFAIMLLCQQKIQGNRFQANWAPKTDNWALDSWAIGPNVQGPTARSQKTAQLSGVQLSGSQFSRVQLSGAKLRHCTAKNVCWDIDLKIGWQRVGGGYRKATIIQWVQIMNKIEWLARIAKKGPFS